MTKQQKRTDYAAGLKYATRLAKGMWERDWKQEAPNWQPFDDLVGVLTQIDNMLAGMEKKKWRNAESSDLRDNPKRNYADGLSGDWVCSGCGANAEEHAISRTHEALCATERDFVEVRGKWKGERYIGGLEGECFGEWGGKQMIWQICGKCEDVRWSEPLRARTFRPEQ